MIVAVYWDAPVTASHDTANRTVGAIASGVARIECTTPADFEAAQAMLAEYPDQSFSFLLLS